MAVKKLLNPNDPNYDPNADPTLPQVEGDVTGTVGGTTIPIPGAPNPNTAGTVYDNGAGDFPPLAGDVPPMGPEVQYASDQIPGAGGGAGIMEGDQVWTDPRGTAAGGVPGADTGTGGSDLNSAYRAALLKMLGQGPVNAQTIAESPAMQAQRLQAQRGQEQQRRNLTEQAAQSGTLGGLEGVNRGLDFATAEGNSQFAGGLAQHQEDQRQQQLLSALGLHQSGVNANNRLGFDYTQLQSQANLQALLAMLQGGGV